MGIEIPNSISHGVSQELTCIVYVKVIEISECTFVNTYFILFNKNFNLVSDAIIKFIASDGKIGLKYCLFYCCYLNCFSYFFIT